MQSFPFRLLQDLKNVFLPVFSRTSALICTAIAALVVLALVFGSFSMLPMDLAASTSPRPVFSKWSDGTNWPQADRKFYKINAMGSKIGFAVYAETRQTNGSTENLAVYLADRIGSSQGLHETHFRLESTPGHNPKLLAQYRLYLQEQPVSEYNFEWTIDTHTDSLIWQRGAPNDGLPFAFSTGSWKTATAEETNAKLQMPQDQPNFPLTQYVFPFAKQLKDSAQQALIKETASSQKLMVINPLRAVVYPVATAHSSGPAKQDVVMVGALKNSLEAEFVASSQSEIESIASTLSSEAVPLNLFTSPASEANDLAKLQETARQCAQNQSEFQEQVVKNLANIPYLLNRNAAILKAFCVGTFELTESFRQTKETALRARLFDQKVKSTLAGNNQEIPRSLVTSSLWPILFDDTKQALWLNSLNILINEAQREQADLIKFEEERKVPVKIQVILSGRTLGTVVRGVIKNKKLVMDIKVDGAQDGNMLPESWTEFPHLQASNEVSETPTEEPQKSRKKSAKKQKVEAELAAQKATKTKIVSTQPYQLFNGRIINESILAKINMVCQAFGGQIGIDLGDAPQFAITPRSADPGSQMSGAWDINTRLQLLELFLRKSLAEKSCAMVSVRVPAEMKPAADRLIAAFEAQIIQNIQEVQLTNSKYRYLALVPGSYELYVNSLVSGELLEKFEFQVLDAQQLGNRAAKIPQDFVLRVTQSSSAKVTEPNNTP